MPELPEVETIRAQLDDVLVGQTLESVEVLREKSWSGEISSIVGRKVGGVDRKGKMLIVELQEKKKKLRYLVIHLKMTGQLIFDENDQFSNRNFQNKSKDRKLHFELDHRVVGLARSRRATRIAGGHPSASWVHDLPDNHTRVVMKLSGGTLYFNDMRVFGWVKVVDGKGLQKMLGRMPPDINERVVNRTWFRELLSRSGRAVKLVVMDSGKLGGVGNIYANDGLWDAKIDPRRVAKSLSNEEADRLVVSLKKVINLGIELGGATASDDKFVQATGLGGKYQKHFLTYERKGEKCKRKDCAGVIEKIKVGGRGTYFCPKCQV